MSSVSKVAVAVMLLYTAVHAKDFLDDRRLQDGGYGDYGGYDGSYDGGYDGSSGGAPTAPPTAAPPTAAPPTTAPTAPPTTPSTTFEMLLDFADISSFNETQFVLDVQHALGQTGVSIQSIEYTVSTEISFSVAVNETEATAVIATVMGVLPENVNVTIVSGGRLLSITVVDEARRLASSFRADIIVTDFEVAKAVQATAESNSTGDALVAALNSAYNKVATVTLGAVSTSVKVITTVEGDNVQAIAGSVKETLEASINEMGGTLTSVTETSAPPTPPTPPTAAPTAPATAEPETEADQDSACTLGAKALALVAASVALREFV